MFATLDVFLCIFYIFVFEISEYVGLEHFQLLFYRVLFYYYYTTNTEKIIQNMYCMQ